MKRKAYRHLLVPTDDSPSARRGVRKAVALARAFGARITALHVVPGPSGHAAVAMLHGGRMLVEDLGKQTARRSSRVLRYAERTAKAAGVRCAAVSVQEDTPWKAILRIARTRRCDLIVLASRGSVVPGWFESPGDAGRVLAAAETSVLVVR